MEFNLASYLFFGSVGIILGLVQVVKLWIGDTRTYPIFSIVFGLIINIGLAKVTGVDLVSSIVMGVIAGLSAAGIYSTATSGKS
jgi:uncharacterized membrane protein